MSITANMVNNAVRVSNRAPFRFYTSGTSTTSTKWETWATYSGSYTPYIAFDYATCVANQSCVNGACVCNAGYYLSGTTCLCTRARSCRQVVFDEVFFSECLRRLSAWHWYRDLPRVCQQRYARRRYLQGTLLWHPDGRVHQHRLEPDQQQLSECACIFLDLIT